MKTFRLITTIFICALIGQLSAQSPLRKGTDYALFFVVADFDHWTDFDEASVQQAREIEKQLTQRYGFKSEFLLNPTRKEIVQKLTADYRNRNFSEHDQLLVYFSMHGHDEGSEGALIPKDGQLSDPSFDSWITHSHLQTWLNSLPCKHVLLSLDACYSGTFSGERSKPNTAPWENIGDCAAKIENALQNKSRLFLTSGGNVRTPVQSDFAKKWLESLQQKNTDGILSFNDLVATLMDANPKPRYGGFAGNEPGGDFVFVVPGECKDSKLSPLAQEEEAWMAAKSVNTIDGYNRFIQQFPNGDFRPLAEEAMNVLKPKLDRFQAWEQAKLINTASAYDKFIREFPNAGELTNLAKFKRAKLNQADGIPEMVLVAGGTLNYHVENDTSAKRIAIDSFWIGKYEVTLEEFSKFVESSGYVTDAEKDASFSGSKIYNDEKFTQRLGINWRNDPHGYFRPKKDFKHPVVHVSLNDAITFCNWLSEQEGYEKVYSSNLAEVNYAANGYRLPTKEEWEFAAQGGRLDHVWAGTSDSTELETFANFGNNSVLTILGFPGTFEVGSMKPNNFGLYDMSGNVREWCWMCSNMPTYEGVNMGVLKAYFCDYAAMMGGGWPEPAEYLKCSFRPTADIDDRDGYTGFRLARTVKE
jgi:formylglycine-generating enzyme required for sulfatase activity